ncbi:MAG TPA: class I SAM-dependent methyltransferase [Burkholderiales bacterium]|jgi:2-polyprenyl-6-hydroxyphenyl methylase/3-demethylubiquinone-9 3-methyltransferase|nr:class I SAM-dependent methyltransferase [Burkholderiales bacterium]
MVPLSASIACKVCGQDAPFFGDVDFSRTGYDEPLRDTGVPIAYYRCGHCEFLFTNAFDAWSAEDFRREIYNEDYAKLDPEFASDRPLACADLLSGMITSLKGKIRLMDYGGGEGAFARRMNEMGFEAYSYDPFFQGELLPREGDRFELINCREVIEHAPDPHAFARDLLRFLADDGAIFLSTVTQPPHMPEIGMAWGYASPRNGHISLYSQKSLAILWAAYGLHTGFYADNAQLVWRGEPACFACLNRGPA